MIGAIGEQAGLCWGFEQDAQRFDATRNKITKEHHRLVLRALSEAGGHFLLGAAHSLGNLGLRIGLLDPQAGPAIQAARPKADFAPGSDDKRAWLSLSVSSEILAKAASGSGNVPLARISAAVSGLAADPRYVALDSRRGIEEPVQVGVIGLVNGLLKSASWRTHMCCAPPAFPHSRIPALSRGVQVGRGGGTGGAVGPGSGRERTL
jgi:hypothetical protein